MYSAPASITTPSNPAPADQPSWNKQQGSPMPFAKYLPYHEEVEDFQLTDRTWPNKRFTHAPLWCAVDLRDGNQALILSLIHI